MSLPHENVYARIQPSPIHGVGVFAIIPIPQGTEVFHGSKTSMTWIKKDEVTNLPEQLKRFYEDFCPEEDGSYGCPESFNAMDVSWYMNHSDNGNIGWKPEGDHFIAYAISDIKEGDELTSDYKTYEDYLK